MFTSIGSDGPWLPLVTTLLVSTATDPKTFAPSYISSLFFWNTFWWYRNMPACPGLAQTCDPPISASQGTWVINMGHHTQRGLGLAHLSKDKSWNTQFQYVTSASITHVILWCRDYFLSSSDLDQSKGNTGAAHLPRRTASLSTCCQLHTGISSHGFCRWLSPGSRVPGQPRYFSVFFSERRILFDNTF